MKKKIVIDAEEPAEVKKTEKNIKKMTCHKLIDNPIVEWLIYMLGYALVLIIVSVLFPSLYISNSLYALLAAIIIYILNQTIKPLINYITLPLTVLSWGILYPITNVIILYITSFILGANNFCIKGIIAPFFLAITISFLNILMEGLVIKPITKKTKQR